MEYGDDVWTTLKDSHHVMRINHCNTDDYAIYESCRNPIFVAKHANSGDFYASQDQSSKIMRIIPSENRTEQIDISEAHGHTSVGLIAGPDGNVWFVLLGTSKGGSGTFGRILEDGNIQWYKLANSLGKQTALIHLAFEETASDKPAKLWLLGSSIISSNVMDALFEVRFDAAYAVIDTISTIVFPTQLSKSHRVLPRPDGIYATELATSALVHITSDPAANTKRYDETSDFYADFGLGVEVNEYTYNAPIRK